MTPQEQHNAECVRQALQLVLAEHESSRLSEYFCDDAVIQINERRLEGLKQIASRLDWIRANRPQVTLTIERVFFQGDRGFDHHTTTLSDGDARSSTIKVFAYIEMRDGKIALYEDVSIALNGQDLLPDATAVQTG
jgi:predicted SnoaL-like aldol condensation-catalyzing enzyme